MPVGRAHAQKHQQAEIHQQKRQRSRLTAARQPARQKHGSKAHRQQNGHVGQLVEEKQGQVPRQHQVGQKEHCRGIIVGAEQHRRVLRVPRDDILMPGPAIFLHPGFISHLPHGLHGPGAEGRLLLTGTADGKPLHHFIQKLHGFILLACRISARPVPWQ